MKKPNKITFVSRLISNEFPIEVLGRKCANAFTLIELLVVVSIISLLVSILLPSLNTAKEIAKDIVCMNYLRNYGVATQLYMEDFDTSFPPYLMDGQTGVNTYTVFHYYRKNGYCDSDMLCPSAQNKEYMIYKYGYATYGYNVLLGLGYFLETMPVLKSSDLIHPENLYMFIDAKGMYTINGTSQTLLDITLSYRHQKNDGLNILFADMRVDKVPATILAGGEIWWPKY